MAIFNEKMYGIQCDVCKDVYRNAHSGYAMYVDEDSAKEEAQEEYWLIEGGKCYCPKCFEIDEDDNVFIKEVV